MIHLGRNTWRELEKRVIRSLKVVYSKTENKGDYSFIHSFFSNNLTDFTKNIFGDDFSFWGLFARLWTGGLKGNFLKFKFSLFFGH